MAIRLRNIQGQQVALCAARSMLLKNDIYLDDAVHGALSAKFARDFNLGFDCNLPYDLAVDKIITDAESNNPNRVWSDITYRDTGKLSSGLLRKAR